MLEEDFEEDVHNLIIQEIERNCLIEARSLSYRAVQRFPNSERILRLYNILKDSVFGDSACFGRL